MSLTVSQDEGRTVLIITSNPNSKWPVLCQILASLFCRPVCSESQDVKEKLTDTQRAFGIVQIMVAVMNFVLGCFGFIFFYLSSAWVNSARGKTTFEQTYPHLTYPSLQVSYGGLQTSVMVLAVLQLCVAFSFCVLTVKSLSKKGRSAKLVEDTTSESRSGICPFSSPFSHCCKMTLTVSQDMNEKLKDTHTALGIVQIIVGVMNIAVGCFCFVSLFWIGGVFLVVGIMSVLAVRFPSPRLLVILVILNVASAALAITAVVLFSMDLATGDSLNCYNGYSSYSSSNDFVNRAREESTFETCLYYRDFNKMIIVGLDIMMIVLSVLQLCVTISFCVLTGKVLCKNEDAKDPEPYKPLLEDAIAGAA